MTPKAIFTKYLTDLADVAGQGDAREESFYPALETMLNGFAEATGKKNVHVTTLPRPTEGGNPDFRLWNGKDKIIGYIEAKRPTQQRLNDIEETEQLQRYLKTFPNLILTNFLEFRLYREGVPVDGVSAGRAHTLNKLGTAPPLENEDELYALLNRFLEFALPQTFTAESLAVELANRTRHLRDVISEEMSDGPKSSDDLSGFFEAFRTYLIGSLTPEEFGDLFAQTITYGLFAARIRAVDDFNRGAAFENIPHTIGVLRDLFRYISLGELPEQLAWCVDDIAEVLAVADAPGILDEYYRDGKGSDPIVHFYETFLAQYDPDERERRGVYYTPEPVVGYIVRSLNEILKTEFALGDGLASEGLTLLDPAAGTMTFVARAAQQAVSEFEAKYGTGGTKDFMRAHILKNFYAFELMMAPYTVGHLKMSFLLQELGYRLANDERMAFYLTNTLDWEKLEQTRIPGLSALAEESRLAGDVKQQTPILCILGNPPYSGHSSNRGDWIRRLIDHYKQVDGKPLGEKNPKWLQDDYVKFLRFAQWKVEQAGRGLVGMITNHGYLDNPTFRGMRRSLMRTFDEIYILNLHGNSLKKETCPDGSPDDNVFDIRQGVAIAFLIKQGGRKGRGNGVHHAEIYGLRQRKYDWLNEHNHVSTDWQRIRPVAPSYLFVPRDEALEAGYRRFTAIPEVFPVNSVGIVTARDGLTIRWSEQETLHTVRAFAGMAPELARRAFELGNDSHDWSVTKAQKDLLDHGIVGEKVVPILYRPFDVRYTYYSGRSQGFICRPRPEVMRHMLAGDNLALIATRQASVDFGYSHVLASKSAVDNRCVYSSRGIMSLMPLYLYPNACPSDLFASLEPSDRQPNLNPDLDAALADAYSREALPEDIFHYIYAILYAPIFREKYAEFLQREFPRVPFASDWGLFSNLASLGERLTQLHLLKSPELDEPTCRFDGQGDSNVAKTKAKGLRYDSDMQRMYINKTQYFGPIPPNVYEYRIGGYQVCDKWLKDRKERRLDLKDIQTYCRMVTAIGHTIAIQEELDGLYPEVEKDLVSIAGE